MQFRQELHAFDLQKIQYYLLSSTKEGNQHSDFILTGINIGDCTYKPGKWAI